MPDGMVTRACDVTRRKDLVEQELVAGRQLDPGCDRLSAPVW
jgi:hypothetical protein